MKKQLGNPYVSYLIAMSIGTLLLFGSMDAHSVIAKDSVSVQPKLTAPLFNNLGPFHYAIDTPSLLAQRYFDQGLLLVHGFDYAEAIRSFQAAIKADPHCAMCYWGLALALGSKNNTPLNGHEKKDAFLSIKRAQKLVDEKNKRENSLINALLHRYSVLHTQREQPSFMHHCAGNQSSTDKEATAYANAMKKVVHAFPNDVEIKNLYVAALFDVTEWKFFDDDGKPLPYTVEIINTLKAALALDSKNPGANHYYIHTMEVSPHPEQAINNALFLSHAVPGGEHYLHMPAHIYMVIGKYHDAATANQMAIAAFKQYQQDCKAQGFSPQINYLYQHNLNFLWAAASMEGQRTLALNTAQELVQVTPPYLVKKDPFLQLFLAIPLFSKIQFGLWDDILKESPPSPNFLFVKGVWHYARGMAYVNLHDLKNARQQLLELKASQVKLSADKNFRESITKELNVAIEMLKAGIAEQSHQTKAMLNALREALKLEDDLGFNEPPVRYFTTRLRLGTVLLKLNQPKAAELLFREDLKQFPANGWALFGLEQSLRAQGKMQAAEKVHQQFKLAWQYADVTLPIAGVL